MSSAWSLLGFRFSRGCSHADFESIRRWDQTMNLVNVTPLAAKVAVSKLAWVRERWGMLIAKATYRIEPQGPVVDVDDPLPIFQESTSTPGGTLPQDTLPRRGDDFEVVVVGEACAPR